LLPPRLRIPIDEVDR